MRVLKYALASVLLPVFFLATGDVSTDAQAKKIKVLIVTQDDVPSHPWRKTTPFTRRVLEETGRFDVKVAEDTGIFEASTLGQYDVIILNYGFWRLPELSSRGRSGLLNFVKNGGGLVPLHFSCASFQKWFS